MIFELELETMPRERLRALQEERLRALVAYVKDRVPLYRERLADVESDHIQSLDDLRALPFTRKDDLRDTYPTGMFAVPADEVARIHASSGTTGKPTIVGYTAGDVELFARANARTLAMAGAEPGMTLHNAYGYGLFTGGLGLHYGGEKLGMTVVPVSGGMTERQLTLIEDLRPEVIASTPSYALVLAQGSPSAGSRRTRTASDSPCSAPSRGPSTCGGRSPRASGCAARTSTGSPRWWGPGVSAECVEERPGSHVNEDHFLAEIVDPDSGEALPDSTEGVLVFTTLTKEALPLVRYWTGDISSLSHETCSCGRSLVRMGPIVGRSDDMIIVRGVNVYPTQVGSVLGKFPELSPHFGLVVRRTDTLDEIEVLAELRDEAPPTRDLNEHIVSLIRHTIGCTMSVTLLPAGQAPRSEGGKIERVRDLR